MQEQAERKISSNHLAEDGRIRQGNYGSMEDQDPQPQNAQPQSAHAQGSQPRAAGHEKEGGKACSS